MLDGVRTARAEVLMGIGRDRGMVPVFRGGERDRGRAWGQGIFMASPGVLLDARWEWLRDVHPDGTRLSGPGDLELGTALRLWRWDPGAASKGEQGLAPWLGWRVKLPNATDAGELGSDETDITASLMLEAWRGPLQLRGGGGLAILGNPLRYTAQDDVPFAALRLCWDPRGPGASSPELWLPALWLESVYAFATTRNPARGELALNLEWGPSWLIGLEAALGLTPAAPDLQLAAWLGWRWW